MSFHSKRKSIFIFLILTLVVFSVSAQNLGERLHKIVTINGERIDKTVKLTAIREYNYHGKEIHYKESNGYEVWYEYDSKENQIHSKASNGYEEWFEYDSKGNIIHWKTSDGNEEWYEYDSKGNKIYWKTQDDYEEWYEYDSNGKEIYWKSSNGDEGYPEYDSYGNICYKTTNSEIWIDPYDNVIYVDFDGFSMEYWYEYDANGNKIYSKESVNGIEEYYEYTYHSNHKIKTCYTYTITG